LYHHIVYHHFTYHYFNDHHFNGLHFNDHYSSGSGSPGIYYYQDYLHRLLLFHELCRGVIFYFFNDFHSLSHNPYLFCERCERDWAVDQLHYALDYNERREPPDHNKVLHAVHYDNSSRISSERGSSAGNEVYDILHALHYDDSSRFGSECGSSAGNEVYYVFHCNELDDSLYHNDPR
ncbi:hypothetical protein LTR16_010806, partial [Cryomyces antarcticus]